MPRRRARCKALRVAGIEHRVTSQNLDAPSAFPWRAPACCVKWNMIFGGFIG
jgi:hypothetical protein